MKRRHALVSLLAAALPVRAQRSSRPARIGYLSARPGPNEFEQAFLRGMRELGYVDGNQMVIDFRWAAFDASRQQTLAAEVVASRPDVIVAPDGGARNVIALDPTIPIVIPAMADPIAAGLTGSLSRPDGSVTGLTMFAIELSRKRLELFKEALPKMQRVGVLFNARRSNPPAGFPATLAAGEALGLELVDMRMPLPDGIAAGFAAAVKQGVQGVVIVSDLATISHSAPLCAASFAHRLPTMFANRTYLKPGGGLMSYGPDLEGAFHRSAYYVDRLLKGAKPADLPIEQPTRFELVVSLKTAEALKLAIPQSLLARADALLQ